MKRAHLGASIISALAAGALTFGTLTFGLAGSAGAAPARPAGTVSVQTVVLDCPGVGALVRPKTFILTCADGYVQLDKLSWTSWTPGLASATGTLSKNTCTPSCVAGHFRSYPVVAVLWGRAALKNHPGEQCYTKMTIIYTGSRPSGTGPTLTISLPTSLPVVGGV
jgi:hypothetical protein